MSCHLLKILTIFSLLKFLTACGHEEKETYKIGVITHTRYWMTEPLRWEGAHRYYKYDELCSPKLLKCLIGKNLTMSQFVSPKNGKLAVTFMEGISSDPPEIRQARSYMLSTITGAEITCENCKIDNLHFGLGDWFKQGTVFSPALYRLDLRPLGKQKETGRQQYLIYFIDFYTRGNTLAARQRSIATTRILKSNLYGTSYSPSSNTSASFECSPKCEIQWLNEDLTGYNSKPTGCASEKLFIVWKSDEPEAVFSNWAQAKDICLNKEDKPMFRQLSFQEETALNIAQPRHEFFSQESQALKNSDNK
jgi:hypothetical protein